MVIYSQREYITKHMEEERLECKIMKCMGMKERRNYMDVIRQTGINSDDTNGSTQIEIWKMK